MEQLEPRLLLTGWNILSVETGDSTGDAGRYSSVAVNDYDTVCVTYLNALQVNGWDNDLQIQAEEYTPGTGWGDGSGARALHGGVEGLFTSVAYDALNEAHISYYDQSNGNLMYNHGTTAHPVTVDSAGDVGQYTSIAADSSNLPHIVYYDKTDGQLKYASSNGTSWTTEVLATVGDASESGTPNVHHLASLAIDKNDHPHVCYYDANSQSLMYMEWTGSAWTTPVAVDAGGGTAYLGVDNSMKLDPQGHPHIAYYDAGNEDLRYAEWNGTAWNIQTLDSTGDVGQYASLSLDGAGNPQIAYSDATNQRLKYMYWDGSAWQSSVIDTDSFGQIEYVSCAMDELGTGFVSYFTDGGNNYVKQLKLAAREGVGTVVNPDMVASVNLPAGETWLPGDKVTVPVTVTNNGINPAQGAVTVNLFRSADGVFDDPQSSGNPDPQAGTLTATVDLAQGQSTQFSFTFVVPTDAQPDPVYLIAQVVASPAIDELITDNNVAVSSETAQVVWQAGNFGGHANSAITVQGSSGVPTKFAISGGGYLDILGAGDFTTINIHDTTPNSAVTISTPVGTSTSVGDIVISGSLEALNAGTVKLRGNLTVEGTVGTLVLGDVQDDHLIDLNSSNSTVDPKLGLSITLAQVADCSLDTHGIPIKSLKVTDWTGSGTITAPWVDSLTVKGDAAHSLAGDFGPDLDLTGQNSKGLALGSVSVAGTMSGKIQASGGVGSIKATAWTAGWLQAPTVTSITVTGRKATLTSPATSGDLEAELTLDGASAGGVSMNTLSVAGAIRSNISASGSISSIKVGSWDSGSLTAHSLGSISITGNLTGSTWTITGPVGTISVLGIVSGWNFDPLDTVTAVKSMSLGNVSGTASSVLVNGAITTLTAGQWLGGTIGAASIGKLTTTGAPKGAAGDLSAQITLDGTGVAAGGKVLGALTVAG